MAEATKIQWTHHTFNPWRGCTKIAPGCANCYAAVDRSVSIHGIQWGPNGTRQIKADSGWNDPIRWDRAAANTGERRRVFCASLADVFEGQETMPKSAWDAVNEARLRLFSIIDVTPNLDWLLLTKRPENIRGMWPLLATTRTIFPGCPGPLGEPQPCHVENAYRPNVWLGTSISDQATADKAIPELIRCRDLAPVLFLSAEPLLGPIDLGAFQPFDGQCYCQEDPKGCKPRSVTGCPAGGIDWVIDGAESGPNKRPYDLTWSRDLQSQCQAAGVAYFRKQIGESIPGLKDKKGGEIDEWPIELRVREFPIVSEATHG